MPFTVESPDVFVTVNSDPENTGKYLFDTRNGSARVGILPYLVGRPTYDNLIFSPDVGSSIIGPRIDKTVEIAPGVYEGGFKYNLTGGDKDGWEYWVVDAESERYEDLFPGWLAPGWTMLFRIPKALAPAAVGGEISIDKFIVSGTWRDFKFGRLSEITVEQKAAGNVQPHWSIESIAIRNKTKIGNVKWADGSYRDKFGSGKIGHMPRPAWAMFNGTDRVGPVVWGRFDDEVLPDDTLKVRKVFNEQEILDAVAAVGYANFTHVVVDATLGYETAGVIVMGSGQEWVGQKMTMPESGTVESVHAYSGGAHNAMAAIYDDDGTPAPTYTKPVNLLAGDGSDNLAMVLDTWANFDITDAPLIAEDIWVGVLTYADFTGNIRVYWDSVGASLGMSLNNGMNITSPPDPFPTTGSQTNNYQTFSIYITYALATSPPVTSNVVCAPHPAAQGTAVALSADITDGDHTITAAEWFDTVDPGQGLGTAMDLGAGTTSREATDTIDTTGWGIGVHSVRVRGYDATDGWGDWDFFNITITEADPGPDQPGRLVGRSVGLKVGRKL